MRFFMKQHEREYFISRIRSGVYYIQSEGKNICIKPPTLEDEFFINEKFKQEYEKCLEEGLKTEDEIVDWMISKELWTHQDDEREEGLKKDIERLKREIYNNRHRSSLREQIRKGIRAGEKQLSQVIDKKSKYFSNSCEGIANLAKISEFFRRCAFEDGVICDFDELRLELISNTYYRLLLSESDVRELARNEPWRSIWVLRDSNSYNLFKNEDRQLSPDQKSLLVWSRMYDNVYESSESPSEEVIKDDDLLDGWFAVQAQEKRDQAMQSEVDDKLSNPKIANSSEVFLMADNRQDAQKINELNSHHAKVVKKQRFNQIKGQGTVNQDQLRDQRIEIGNQSNQQFKDKFRS